MTDGHDVASVALNNALHGTGAHVDTGTIFAGLGWKQAGVRPPGAPHSVYEILTHMLYWNEWAVKRLGGAKPPVPKHASGGWPGGAGPASKKEWDRAVRRFHETLKALDAAASGGDLTTKTRATSRLEVLHAMASHNSYHAGQVVVLRQILGAWPPPGGGLTW